MARYIKAVECAEIISKKLNIPLGDLVDIFAEIPTADVVPKSEVAREIFEQVEKIILENTYPYFTKDGKPCNIWKPISGYDALAELKKKYTEGEQRND